MAISPAILCILMRSSLASFLQQLPQSPPPRVCQSPIHSLDSNNISPRKLARKTPHQGLRLLSRRYFALCQMPSGLYDKPESLQLKKSEIDPPRTHNAAKMFY